MTEHVPVLFGAALAALDIQTDGCYLDATFGRGGHARGILRRLGAGGRLLAMDKDPAAEQAARALMAREPRLHFRRGSFAAMEPFLREHGVWGALDGVLMDLGVSSPQLDTPERGFSFNREGPLDMRMDPSTGRSAADWLAGADEEEIADVIRRFGEERHARRIARCIVAARAKAPVCTTQRLAEIVRAAVPGREPGKDPATRTFQAIRIYINDELQDLQLGLEKALQALGTHGRLAVISFHSLEDRIVKRFLRAHSRPAQAPRKLPVTASDSVAPLRLLGKPVRPAADEVAANPRARSAVLRVAEKIR